MENQTTLPSLAVAPARPSTRKGQSMTVDFILSISIFLLLLALAYNAWQRDLQRIDDSVIQSRADEAARRGLESLVDSSGFPSNWAALNLSPNDSALLGLGAADAPGQLDDYKLRQLQHWFNSSGDYNATRLKMGLSPFEADAKVSALDGTALFTLGSPPNSSATVRASAQRLAQWENNTVLVRLRVWTVSP